LIHDRDPVFTAASAEILKSAGVKALKLPPQSPNLNAFAERFVRSARDGCVRRLIPLGEWHLRRIISKYVEHYHRERHHQGLENQLIMAPAGNENSAGPVQCRGVDGARS
jgi:putative transposase